MSETVRKAFILASEAHKHQMYDEKFPYMLHVHDVMMVLVEFGFTDPDLLAAALLHDTIEDTATKYHHIKDATNQEVAEIVLALTDEIARNRKERKARTLIKINDFPSAQTVKLADWIANVRQCLRTKGKMLKMYQDEFPEFAIYKSQTSDEKVLNLWAELEKLLGVNPLYIENQ